MTSLERDIEALVGSFARDFAMLVRHAPLGDVRALLAGAPPSRPSAATWADRYRLSPVEMWILDAALRGLNRERMAAERGTALVTTKAQISTLLKKTGDRSLLAAVAPPSSRTHLARRYACRRAANTSVGRSDSSRRAAAIDRAANFADAPR